MRAQRQRKECPHKSAIFDSFFEIFAATVWSLIKLSTEKKIYYQQSMSLGNNTIVFIYFWRILTILWIFFFKMATFEEGLEHRQDFPAAIFELFR